MYLGESGDQEGCSSALLGKALSGLQILCFHSLFEHCLLPRHSSASLHGISLKIKTSKGHFVQKGNRKSAGHRSKLLTTH